MRRKHYGLNRRYSGADHDRVRADIVALLHFWRVTHTAVDATGIGEPIATHLANEFADRKVTALKFSRATKSSLGYDLLAAANNGAIRVWQPDGEHHATLWRQLRLARRELLPGGQLAWHVDEKEGHDDHLLSLALALRAAQRGRPRIARSRPNRAQ